MYKATLFDRVLSSSLVSKFEEFKRGKHPFVPSTRVLQWGCHDANKQTVTVPWSHCRDLWIRHKLINVTGKFTVQMCHTWQRAALDSCPHHPYQNQLRGIKNIIKYQMCQYCWLVKLLNYSSRMLFKSKSCCCFQSVWHTFKYWILFHTTLLIWCTCMKWAGGVQSSPKDRWRCVIVVICYYFWNMMIVQTVNQRWVNFHVTVLFMNSQFPNINCQSQNKLE